MKSLKIFISSSRELNNERIELENEIGQIAEENRKAGVSVELDIWEKHEAHITDQSKQDKYLQALTECEIFICLIHSQVGQFTREELELALANCTAGRKPNFIFVFFKNMINIAAIPRQNMNAVLDLKEYLEDQRQFPIFFDHINDIKLILRRDLMKILKQSTGAQSGWERTLLPPRFSHRRTIGFTNRVQEIDQIVSRLVNREAVHLRGMGGVGKTELAIELCHLCIEKFGDGIIWHFAEKSQLEELLNRILTDYQSDSLSLPLEEKKTVVQKILGGKNALIVLDNVEWHNREAVQELIDLAPDCAILITTRPYKGLSFERTVPYELNELEEKDTIALFERKTTRSLTNAEKTDVAQIYKMIGGLPLLIELAARWAESSQTKTEQLVKWISEKDIEFLTEENSKIQAIFDYTSNQMNDKEKEVFSVLGVFSGQTFTLEAVEMISKATDIECTLHKFIGLSLLKINKNRFHLHPLLKFHAKAMLSNNLYKQRMMYYYLNFMESAKHVSAIDAEKENIIGALDFAAANHDDDNTLSFIEFLSSPTNAYYGFFARQGYWQEGMKRAEQAIEICRRLGKENLQAWYETCMGLYHYWLGHNDQARLFYVEAQAIFEKTKDDKGLIVCLHQLGYIEDDENYYSKARAVYTESLNLAQQINDQSLIALGYHLVGVAAYHQGRYDEAQQHIEQAIEMDQHLGMSQAVARNKRRLAAVLRMKAHYAEPTRRADILQQAYAHIEDALRNESHARNQARGYRQLGMLFEEDNQLDKALEYYEKSLMKFESIQNKKGIGSVKYNLASYHEKVGQFNDARQLYQESMEIAEQVNCRYGTASAWRQLGSLSKKENDLEQAKRAYDESIKIFNAIQSPFTEEARKIRQEL